MLTYHGSTSTEYAWINYNTHLYPDENFAREIMQLFSIGLVHLNIDGTPKLDNHGQQQLTYSNDDIMEYSRAWTGFGERILQRILHDQLPGSLIHCILFTT